ncbi:HAD family hydrolase [filamentous cyanobacterium LEGE 11480]|uniref:HAD family hydrolase n=1 Tax=Romeriopsis navalis LEGE 11480 TaxID=2777977 RepID=A0A928VTL9_9CYAN|nr:HAD family hydrolase [Romeriopsis navalis]MBE9032350.1 HAD family hydrolase [Romeriopsis navalis LEGE 11480]
MALPQALLFDVDGTLADTERDGHRVAFNQAFQDAGLDWDWTPELYGELLAVAGGKERIKHFIETKHPTHPAQADLTAWIAGLHKAKTQHYKDLLAAGTIPLRPGVKRLIDEARDAGVRIAISTTTTPDNVYALLENALAPGSSDWFEVIAAGDVVPAKKPATDIYLYAMEKMQLQPSECLAFEDSYNGVRSSVDADIKTIITHNGYTQSHDFTGATLVLSDMGEPNAPFTVISGDAGSSTYLDLALISTMF